MSNTQNKSPCRSCNALLLGSGEGTRHNPHEYLMAAGARTPEGSARYSCLVCSSTLLQRKEGGFSRWSPAE